MKQFIMNSNSALAQSWSRSSKKVLMKSFRSLYLRFLQCATLTQQQCQQNYQCADCVNKDMVQELDRRSIGELRWSKALWLITLCCYHSFQIFCRIFSPGSFLAQESVNPGTSSHNILIASEVSERKWVESGEREREGRCHAYHRPCCWSRFGVWSTRSCRRSSAKRKPMRTEGTPIGGLLVSKRKAAATAVPRSASNTPHTMGLRSLHVHVPQFWDLAGCALLKTITSLSVGIIFLR